MQTTTTAGVGLSTPEHGSTIALFGVAPSLTQATCRTIDSPREESR